MMTKKDFIALADHVRAWWKPLRPDQMAARWTQETIDACNGYREGCVRSLAKFCESQNPRFNRERWLGYIRGECGPNGGAIRKKGK